jgi:CubicO group peptidase (beta-lactamase class C family)
MVTYGSQSTDFDDAFSPSENNAPRDFSGVALITSGENIIFNASNSPIKDHENVDFNINTQFIIGSLSKQITAALVLREVDKGMLKLDEPLSTYLPELKQKWASEVTLRNLLNHTSGIVKLTQPLKTKPGEVFAYSNLGYNLLGQIVSEISDKPYSSLAMQLFGLCSMDNSVSVAENSLSPVSLAGSYHEKEIGKLDFVTSQFPYSYTPSGGIISTAYDLSKWNQCLHKSSLLSAEAHKEMVKKASVRKHRWGDLGYGFALQISNDLDITEWSHSGYVKGYISTMSYYPESNTSLIVLENVSWYPKDMSRVFYYHDRLREKLLSVLAK